MAPPRCSAKVFIQFIIHIIYNNSLRARLDALVNTVGGNFVDGGRDLELAVGKLADDEKVLAITGLLGLGPSVAIGGNKAGNGNAVLAILLELLAKGEGDLGGAEGRGGDHGVLVAVAGDCDFGVGGLGKLALDVAKTCRNGLEEVKKPRNFGQGKNTPISERKLSKFSDLVRRYLPTTMSCMIVVLYVTLAGASMNREEQYRRIASHVLFFYPRYRRVFIAHPRFFP